MSRQIHCHKCGEYLGEIRDAKLKKDMYHVCGKCVRVDSLKRQTASSNPFPWMKDFK